MPGRITYKDTRQATADSSLAKTSTIDSRNRAAYEPDCFGCVERPSRRC